MPRKAQKSSETFNRPYAKMIRELMSDNAVTQTALAQAIGIQRQTVSNYAIGQSAPDAEMIVKLCDFFHVSADRILGRTIEEGDDRNAAQIAENWTGLSQRALAVLHNLHCLGYNMSALNALLERVSFYRTVLEEVENAVDCIALLPADERETPSSEGEAALLLTKNGWVTLDPGRALSYHARCAGDELAREIHNIGDEKANSYLAKFGNSLNEDFIMALRMKKEAE